MLSRVADSLYWMSRYMERTDGILRMLKINYASSQDDMHEFSWMPVLKIFTFLSDEEAAKIAHDARAVLQFMVTDKQNQNSVLNIVTNARENGRSVQDHITKEMWQCLNDFYHAMRDYRLEKWLQKDDPVTVLDNLLKNCLLYFGTTEITMARGESNAFINIGKYLERALQSSDILDVKFSSLNYELDKIADTPYWKYLLMSISGYELYLKSYRSGFEAKKVVEQIVLKDEFPRSILHCTVRLHRYFEKIKHTSNADAYDEIEFMIGKLKNRIKYSTVESITDEGLHQFLMNTKSSLYEIGDSLSKKYFAYS